MTLTDTTEDYAVLGLMGPDVARIATEVGAEALAKARESGRSHVVPLILEDAGAIPLGHEPEYFGDAIIGETSSSALGYRVGRPSRLPMCAARLKMARKSRSTSRAHTSLQKSLSGRSAIQTALG